MPWKGAVLAFMVLMLPGAAPMPRPQLLVVTLATGYRHESIEAGVTALEAMGARRGWRVRTTADADVFAEHSLSEVDVVVLLHTTTMPDDPKSEWLTGKRLAAFQRFIQRGGDVVAIHAAADSHYHTPWWGRMIGARFARHPEGTPEGRLVLVDGGDQLRRRDEWYFFKDQDWSVDFLVLLHDASIEDTLDHPAPMAWRHRFEGGRVWYTAMGHTTESFGEAWFLRHLEGGIDWALRR